MLLQYLDIDDLIRESAIISNKILLANKIYGYITQENELSYETAKALLLPLYDYDEEFFKSESGIEDAYQNKAIKMSFSRTVEDLIKKLFRLFYNMFKQLQEKLIIWLHAIKPYIEKLETRINTVDFSKVTDFNEGDHERIVNILGVYCLFNGKLSDDILPRIITSFKNMKDINIALNGYNEYIDSTSKNLIVAKDSDDIVEENFIKDSESSLNRKFFDKMPKFYKDISNQLETLITNKSIKSSINLSKVYDAHIVSTNGIDLNIIYSLSDGLIDRVKLRHCTASIITSKFVNEVSLKPLDNSKINMLLKAIKDNDLKKLSESIRSTFKKLENDLDKIMDDMNHKNFNHGVINFIGQIARTTFSENLSLLNTVCFNYINQNSKLTVNSLKLIEISLNKYETKKNP